jgi:DNA excision repair protein ERCC-2
VDARCRDLTNAATVNKAREEPGSIEVCDFHEVGNFFSPGTVLLLKDVLEEHE